VFHISNTGTLKTIYFASFYSGMKYGIILWGCSCNTVGKIVKIRVGAEPLYTCRNLF